MKTTAMAALATALTACTQLPRQPELSGSAMMLNVSPAPPQFIGGYDFELLETIRGESCTTRASMATATYWVAIEGLDKISRDDLTRRAIAAAAFTAVAAMEGIDAIVLTRAITTGHGPDKVCAKIFGRAVRLEKAEKPAAQPSSAPAPN